MQNVTRNMVLAIMAAAGFSASTVWAQPCTTPAECDDLISCTVDDCVGNVCTHVATDSLCDDGLFCNGAETCSAVLGCQAGTAPCVDLVACTTDSCDEITDMCTFTPNNALCDDGLFCNGAETCDALLGCQAGTAPCVDLVACTTDSCDEITDTCTFTPNNALCDDGLFCNGAETCDALLGCQAGTAPCVDLVACTTDSCDEITDTCTFTPNNALCDDGLFCNGAETCDALLGCQAGTAPCVDLVACTTDSCDEITDTCTFTPNNALCDDGLFCNGAETCDALLGCQAGTAPCVDLVACTTDSCDEITDTCTFTPNNALCDDGLFCNGAETCDALLGCQAGTAPCVDLVACTTDSCDEITDTCTFTPNNALCDDGLFCNGAETCDALLGCQAGTAPCVDLVACTTDSCDEITDTCTFTPNNALCDDGLFCNGAETCDALLGCQAGTAPCVDLVACTTDSCDEITDTCTFTPNNALCDDGLFCNGAETCDALLGCQAGTAPCVDLVACTTDSCDEITDTCTFTPNNALCDDGLFCNGAETCDALLGCQAGTAVNCNDGVGCTTDTCDEPSDMCLNQVVNSVCDNGLFCDGMEICDPVLDCIAGTAVDCNDLVLCTVDTCDEVNDTCLNAPSNALCDNGLFCDGVETCDMSLGCQPGAPVTCNDGVACTTDSCNEGTDACVNSPSDAACADALFCNGVETCDALLGCLAGVNPCSGATPNCNEAADACVACLVDGDCADGLFCNGVETCVAGACQPGTAVDCNDGVGCTTDMCDEPSDMCLNLVVNSVCDNGLFCDGMETCDPVLDCIAGTPVDCNDMIACTVDSCDEVNDTCLNAPSNALCDNGLFCDGVETCDMSLGCQAGTAVSCNDGVGCTTDSCNEGTDACVNSPSGAACDDGLFCNGVETCDPVLGCQVGVNPCSGATPTCVEATDTCVACLVNGDCNDGLFCNGPETCLAGVCQPGTAVNCDDGVGCTVDTCDEGTDACVNTPSDIGCDNGLFCDGVETCSAVLGCISATPVNCSDSIACTVDTCDEATDSCVHTANNALCADALFCNGAEVCNPATGCQAVAPLTCSDGIGCTVDVCDELINVCLNIVQNANCNDGLACNGVETCSATLDCVAGTPIDCDDGVGCTIDACDEPTDSCSNTASNAACDNGQFCDGVETCNPVLDCQAGTPVNCSDGVSCTTDTCDEVADACVNTTVSGVCNNGLFCDGVETCDPILGCISAAPVNCNDGVSCTIDSCDEANDACVNTATQGLCNNGLFCDGMETCDPVAGCMPATAVNCDDGIACTADNCNEVIDACAFTPINAVCDDGLFCNGVETCSTISGCVAGTSLACNDGLNCTVDMCDESTDSCINTPIGGCVECFTAADCNDGVTCTIDSCVAGSCIHAASNAVCDNGLFCDGVETCDTVLGCRAGTLVNCADGVGCTTDTCNEASDQCVHTPSNGLCSDGLFCNGAETCDAVLGCRSSGPPCIDSIACTFDACNETTDICINVPIHFACDNGNFCDGTEVCSVAAAGCAAGPNPCDDVVDCTADTCNETTNSCAHTPLDFLCDDGQTLNGQETCSPTLDCQPGDPVDLVRVVPVVRQTASGLNTANGSPPSNDIELEEDMPFVVEIWAQQIYNPASPALRGLCCVFTDLTYASGAMTCNGVSAGAQYGNFASGTCTPGRVEEVGGCTFTTLLGITPQWVRVASVNMTANSSNQDVVFASAAAATTISICQFGNVSAQQVVYSSSPPIQIGASCLYDLDGDTCITGGDLAFFAPCWLTCNTGPNWVVDNCSDSDFDCSGCVDGGDLSFFATGWLRCCGDPLIVFPPLPCGTANGQALPPASRAVIESFGLSYPQEWDPRFKRLSEEEISVDIPTKAPANGEPIGTNGFDLRDATDSGTRREHSETGAAGSSANKGRASAWEDRKR